MLLNSLAITTFGKHPEIIPWLEGTQVFIFSAEFASSLCTPCFSSESPSPAQAASELSTTSYQLLIVIIICNHAQFAALLKFPLWLTSIESPHPKYTNYHCCCLVSPLYFPSTHYLRQHSLNNSVCHNLFWFVVFFIGLFVTNSTTICLKVRSGVKKTPWFKTLSE